MPATLALWDFNSVPPDGSTTTGTTVPSLGSGTLTAIGGVSATFFSGTGSTDPATSDDSALGLTAFPSQSTANKTAGLELAVDTTGYGSVVLTFDQRNSGTASGREVVQYSLDGGLTWTDHTTLTLTTSTGFANARTVDLSGVAGASDNPNLRLRIVSAFDGSAYVGTSNTYGTGGTWRFDMLSVDATVLPVVTVAVVADAVEGEAEGAIRLTRTGDVSGELTVSYTTRDGFSDLATPGADYVQLAGAVTFQPGAATADIVITTVDDDVPEPWEFVTIDVASASGYVVGAEAAGTVRIDDSDGNGVTVGVLDTAPAAEGDSPGWFRLLRGGDLGQPLTVPYTLSGTASPSDYTVSGVPGEVTFAAGESEAFVYLSREPGRPGADGSTVTLALTPGLEYVVTNTTGTLLLIAAPPVGEGSVTVTGKDTYFELSKAVNLNLTKSTVSVEVAAKDVPITVTAYNSGRLGYKIYSDRVHSPNGAAISLVATTGSEAVMKDLKWLQFATRTGTLPNNQPFTQSFRASRVSNDLRKDEVIYYADKQWVVDTPAKNSAFVGPGAILVRGTSGTGHAMAFQDAPGYYPDSDFTSQAFLARTYLVYQKQILYTVQWSITVTKGPDGKWSDPVVSLDKSGPGKLDFPADVDVNADEWLWGYQDSARQKPIKIANPLK